MYGRGAGAALGSGVTHSVHMIHARPTPRARLWLCPIRGTYSGQPKTCTWCPLQLVWDPCCTWCPPQPLQGGPCIPCGACTSQSEHHMPRVAPHVCHMQHSPGLAGADAACSSGPGWLEWTLCALDLVWTQSGLWGWPSAIHPTQGQTVLWAHRDVFDTPELKEMGETVHKTKSPKVSVLLWHLAGKRGQKRGK